MTTVVCPRCERRIDEGLAPHQRSARCYVIIATRDLLSRGLVRAAGWPYHSVLPKAGIENVRGYFLDRIGERFVTGRNCVKRHTWGPAWAVTMVRTLNNGHVSTASMIRILKLAKKRGPDDPEVLAELALAALGR